MEWLTAPLGIDTRRPRFTWNLRARAVDAQNLRQRAYRLIVATSEHAIREERGDVWDSGEVSTSEMAALPARELPFTAQSTFYWAVKTWDRERRASAWSAPQFFVTGFFAAEDWRARWIAADSDPAGLLDHPPPAINTSPPVEPKPLPIFQREVAIGKSIRSAIVSVSGLGHYDLTINDQAVSPGVLNPGWTNYRKTVLYNTFDVTTLLRQGANVLSVMLGNGMFNVEKHAGRYTKFAGTFGQPKLILQLKLAFSDGEEQTIVSDRSWRARPGPIVFSSPYGGEDFDARLTNGQDWKPALEVHGPGGVLRAQGLPQIEVMRTLQPKSVTQPKPGVWVYDLGENFSGWPKIQVRGTAGQQIKLIPGELLDDKGFVTQRSANASPEREARFVYTLAGQGEETWRPRFSYWGFRYVQVEGLEPLSLIGEFLYTDLPRVGEFNCDQPLLTRTHQLIVQALLSNTFSVLTDCPHREKLGWLEQTHLNADTVFYNLDAVTLYRKTLRDMQDAQLPSGLVPEIAPEFVAFLNNDGSDSIFRESPEWGAAIILSTWAAYRYSGDRRLLENGYDSMRRYVAYLETRRTSEGFLDHGLGDWYDIGPKPVGESQLTSRKLTGTATFYQMLDTLACIAAILDKPADTAHFKAHAASVKQVINTKLFDAKSNRYDRGSMTAYAMPLALGIVPEERRAAVLANLIADIRAHQNHVTAGDVGFHYVVRALMENGRGDVLHSMLSRADSPSYGAQLAQGATALTEAWDANPTKSQNHFMLGHAETWFYGGLAGIRVDLSQAAPSQICIAPQPVEGVGSASAEYRSALGTVRSAWTKRQGRLVLQVEIPAGAQAQVIFGASRRTLGSGHHKLDFALA